MRLFLILFLSLIPVWSEATCKLPDRFPYQQGWLGGDVGTSLQLPNGKTFWIFGDSFVEKSSDGEVNSTRAASTFINNSIGLSDCNNSKFSIEYFWKHDQDVAVAFFKNPRKEYYWPLASFFVNNHLFISLIRIKNIDPASGGFSQEGVDLVRVENWHQSPDQWELHYLALSDNKDIFPTSEVVVDKDHVYFYAHRLAGWGVHENVVARIKSSDLSAKSDVRGDLNYLYDDGSYAPLTNKKLKVILENGNTELSVIKVQDGWRLIQMNRRRLMQIFGKETGKVLADQVVVYRGKDFLGPWTDATVIYETPETTSNHPSFGAENFCYAAKAHKGFEPISTDLPFAITYVCNSNNQNLVIDQMEIYTPIKVPGRVKGK